MGKTFPVLAVGRVRVVCSALLAAVLASFGAVPTSAYYFQNYVSWANGAVEGGIGNSTCASSATSFLDFVYELVQEKPPTVGTGQLTSACTECSTALDNLLQWLPNVQPSVCPLLPSTPYSNLTALSLRRFVCLGQSGSSGAGACVVQAVSALKSVGLLARVRTQDPTLTFTGELLQQLCSALFPPPPAPPSCCPRTWAYLMAALAQQSCLPGLAHQYLSLPGRCSAVLNTDVPGFCDASWPVALLPLLTPPPVCGQPEGAQAPAWANGTACSAAQLDLQVSPSSTCDLWCGVVATMQMVDSGVIPTPGTGNDGSTNAVPDGGSGGGGGGEQLQTVTIVIVGIFSVLIALLLLAMAMYAWKIHKENKQLERERFSFPTELNFPPSGIGTNPDPGTTAKRLADAASSSADGSRATSKTMYTAATDFAAAPAASAAAVITPRYQPGPAGALATHSFAGDRAPSPSSYSRQVSNPAAVVVASANLAPARTGSSSGYTQLGAVATGGIGRTSINSRASSSKYESAASIFPKSAGPASSTTLTPGGGLTPQGSVGSPEAVAAVAGVVVMGAGAAGSAYGDRVRSHAVSFSGSDTTIYHSVQSPLASAYMLGGASTLSLASQDPDNAAAGSVPSQRDGRQPSHLPSPAPSNASPLGRR